MNTLKQNDFSHFEILSRRYELRECLAVASVGLLYRARDLQAVSQAAPDAGSAPDEQHEHAKSDVFVHVLPEDFASSIAMASQLQQQNRKLREAGLPHILTVREFGRDRDKVFAVLDHPDARLHVLDSQQMNNERGLLPQIVDGLAHLHRYDLMHGGLEAQVFLVSDRNHVYLWGTGVMPVMCRNQSSLCMEDSPYLSPERYLGVEPRRRDDIYALGVQLYHWKTGRWPYQSANAVRARENGENPVPVSEFVEPGAFSEAQWALLKSALSLDASQRPAHIAELVPVFEPPHQQRTVPLWQWALIAGVLLTAAAGLYIFMQSDVRSTFAEPVLRQVAIPATATSTPVPAPVLPEFTVTVMPSPSTPSADEPVVVAAVTPDIPTVVADASSSETSEEKGDTVDVSTEPASELAEVEVTDVEKVPKVEQTETVTELVTEQAPTSEPVKIYLQDAPADDAAETAIADTPAEQESQVSEEVAAEKAPEEKVKPAEDKAQTDTKTADAAAEETQRAEPEQRQQATSTTPAEPDEEQEPRIVWSENSQPAATDALASLEQELIYGGESVYPPFEASRSAESTRTQVSAPTRQVNSASNAPNASNATPATGRSGRDLRGIPLSRWTAQELSLRANQALRSGRLDEEANRGAVYFIRHLKRFHRGHPDIKRLAGGVVSGLHKRAQAQLAQKQKLQMGRTLFFAKKFIREFNLVGYNAVQEKLEHEQDDLPRPR